MRTTQEAADAAHPMNQADSTNEHSLQSSSTSLNAYSQVNVDNDVVTETTARSEAALLLEIAKYLYACMTASRSGRSSEKKVNNSYVHKSFKSVYLLGSHVIDEKLRDFLLEQTRWSPKHVSFGSESSIACRDVASFAKAVTEATLSELGAVEDTDEVAQAALMKTFDVCRMAQNELRWSERW